MGRRASVCIASAALVAGGAVASVLTPCGRPVVPHCQPPGSATAAHSPRAELGRALTSPTGRPAPLPLPAELQVAPAPERALDELERLLAHEPFDDATFVLAARTLAHRIDHGTLAAALAASAAPARLVAAAELSRARVEPESEDIELPPQALFRLRTLALTEPGPLGDVAARAVLALGSPAELGPWVAALQDDSAELRERAARALAFAPAPAAALELAAALAEVQDAGTLGLAAASLARLAARLDAEARAELSAKLAWLVGLPALAHPAREQVQALLVQLDGANRTEPGTTLLDPSQSPELRLAAAESLARSPAAAPPAARAEALATLHAALAATAPAATRHRALYALGSLAAPESAGEVAYHARFDHDPTVRSAALRALRGFEPELRNTLLSTAAANELEGAVRAVAISELALAALPTRN